MCKTGPREKLDGRGENVTSAPLIFVTVSLVFTVETELPRKRRVQIVDQDSPTKTFENSSNKCKNSNMISWRNDINKNYSEKKDF